tara:strand:+ start:453 stop:935 length:483 start_codon:yes stop_codon:yes gene_type:complete
MSNARTLASLIDGSNIVVPSGFGLDFSANANASGMTSEVLDDYEEGTWSNSGFSNLTNVSFSTAVQTGKYIKIGNQVTLFYSNATGSVTSTGTDIKLNIDGLPFSADATSAGVHFDGYREMMGGILIGVSNNYAIIHFDSEVVDFTGTVHINLTLTYLTS